MLGRLLHTAASSLNPNSYTSRHSTPLESAEENDYTRGLLFPDPSLLQHSQSHAYPISSPQTSSSLGTFDDHGGLELDVTKDFRIIIAQDAYGGQDPCVLFDTQHSPPSTTSHGLGIDPKAVETSKSSHSRNPSGSKFFSGASQTGLAGGNPFPLLSQPSASVGSTRSLQRPSNPPPTGAFCRSKLRSSTLSTPSDRESSQSRLDADAKEETTALLNCMFGSTIIPYKGPSTKMHVLSPDSGSAATSSVTSPVLGRDVDAFSPNEMRKRASLPRANTISPILGEGKGAPPLELKGPTKSTVLLTRTFAINLPEGGESSDELREQEGTSLEQVQPHGFPFPETSNSQSGPKPKKMKAKKTPVYAAAVILQLPFPTKNFSRPPSRHQSASYAQPGISIPSSFDSQQSEWTFLDSPSGIFSPVLASSSALDDRIDLLVHHWDVITRTLSFLEKAAAKEIFDLLMHVDALSPAPQPAKKEGMQKTNQRFVRLSPNALYNVRNLRRNAELAVRRISMALRIPRVVTGQERWGIWRDEARWIGRRTGGREQNFFFFNLLTAFLGNHTEWLNSLGPSRYKRRHYMQQKAHQDAEPVISQRTVIVSADKMSARKLIFLLSSFLPPQHKIEAVGSPVRPGTSVSRRGYSPSPPTNSLAREESLRRTMNRQKLDQRRHGNRDSAQHHERSTSLSSVDAPPGEAADKLDLLERVLTDQLRRDSDVRSIRIPSLPIPANDISTRKSSAATTSTVTPNRTTPVAYITSRNIRPMFNNGMRSESNDSIASAQLLQTLRRSESTNMSTDGTDSHTGSRWGSYITNMWSSKRGSSTDGSEITVPPATPNKKSGTESSQDTAASCRSQNTLKDMANEVVVRDEQPKGVRGSDQSNGNGVAMDSRRPSLENAITESPEVHLVREEPQKPHRSPIKLQVDENDGVVDVDIALPNFFSSSIDSAINSPAKDFRQSVASLDGLTSLHNYASTATHAQRDHSGGNLNVAGWLQTYHDDFCLQSVLPYPQLEEDIKRSMVSEATPAGMVGNSISENGTPAEKWVTICSTLIADYSTFTIKRLRLKRKIKVGLPQATLASDVDFRPSPMNESQLGSLLTASAMKQAHSDIVVEEKFIEDPVMDLDDVLSDAVERILARSGHSSKVHSRASSPSGRGRGRHVENRGCDTPAPTNTLGTVSLEVPRAECRKMVLGALEQVVRSVVAETLRDEGGRAGPKGQEGLSRSGSTTRLADNTLREGIRKWLEEVEE